MAGPFFCVKGKAFLGAGWTDCHTSESVTGFAMTGFLQEVRCKSGGGVRAPRPMVRFVGADDSVRPASITQRLVGQGPCALPGAEKTCRAVEDAGPYGGLQEGAVCRADVGIGPYGSVSCGA